MKVFLDDKRPTPVGWVGVDTAEGAIRLLEFCDVTDISLDHDLGDDPSVGNGNDVLLWIERKVYEEGWNPPRIKVHSANPPAVKKMMAGIQSIETRSAENKMNG